MKYKNNYCVNCEENVNFSEDGYCLGCGDHTDNVIPASYRTELNY